MILLMLRWEDSSLVVKPIALEAYFENFLNLAKDHPECWHLCQKAEDRCRVEHFPRLLRKLQEVKADASWSEVFLAAAEDDRYWDREVRRPALQFLAKGQAPQSTIEAEEERRENAIFVSGNGEPQRKKSKGARKKETKKRRLPAFPEAMPRSASKAGGSGSGNGGNGGHPKKDHRGRYTTIKDGTEICYKFAAGEKGACPDPCPKRRAHVCQKCLRDHRNEDCE